MFWFCGGTCINLENTENYKIKLPCLHFKSDFIPAVTSMCLLRTLPETLAESVLLLWIGLKELGRLDAALCNRSERTNFLSLVCSPTFILRNCDVSRLSGQRFQRFDLITAWLVRRQISSSELTATTSFFENTTDRLRYVYGRGIHVRKVSIWRDHGCTTLRNFADMFHDLCGHCPNLQVLHSEIDLPLELIAAHWKQLAVLTTRMPGTADGLMAIGANCQSLMEITLQGRSSLSALPVAFFESCSPKLQRFTSDSAVFETAHYKAISQRCPDLRELNVPGKWLDDEVLTALGAGCPLLELLQLPANTAVTDTGFTTVARNGALTTLCIGNCPRVTGVGLITVVECCVRLEIVDLTGPEVTDTTLIALGQHCHKLRRLILRSTNVTHVGVKAIAAGCPLLEELTAYNCGAIGPAMEAIARNCPFLRCLRTEPAVVPAEAVLALAACCPLLETLEGGNSTVRDAEISVLVRGCPALLGLDISSTCVRSAGLAAIRDHCKHLKCIELAEYMYPRCEYDGMFFPPRVRVGLNTV
jgi:hypothetical protein